MTDGGTTQSGFIIYDFDARNLPDAYLRAIGLVTAVNAQTESSIHDLIGSLLGIDNIATLALTAHLSAPQREQICRSIAELNVGRACHLDEIDELLDDVSAATAKRNAIVHNSYCIHPQSGEVHSYRLKARGRLELELKPITVDELLTAAEEIHQAGLKIAEFMIRCGIAPIERVRPLKEPIERTAKARAGRRDKFGNAY